jgi:hypothetical protein
MPMLLIVLVVIFVVVFAFEFAAMRWGYDSRDDFRVRSDGFRELIGRVHSDHTTAEERQAGG